MNWHQQIAKAAGVTKEELLATVDSEAASVVFMGKNGAMLIDEMLSRMEKLASTRAEIERMFGDGETPSGWRIIKDQIDSK